MDTVIQFTPTQLLVYAGAIITISSALAIIFNLVAKIKEPEKKQDERIKACEDRIDKLESNGEHDDKRFKEIEEGNKITQEALLALLKHSINGDEIEALKDAEKNLEKYLINK